MPKLTGELLPPVSLPPDVERLLAQRCKAILMSRGLASAVVQQIVSELIDEVSFSYAGREHKLELDGAGRPPNGPANILSSNIADLLKRHGIRGNWVGYTDLDGLTGPVAELEAIAQTALREACGDLGGVLARPARISKSRRILGKILRS